MIYLIDNSKRVDKVIEALRETHRHDSGILVVNQEDYNYTTIYALIKDCNYNHIVLIIVTNSIELLRVPKYNLCCIFPDGSGEWEKRSRDGDLVIEPNQRIAI